MLDSNTQFKFFTHVNLKSLNVSLFPTVQSEDDILRVKFLRLGKHAIT